MRLKELARLYRTQYFTCCIDVMFSNFALHIPINFVSIVAEILAICGGFY